MDASLSEPTIAAAMVPSDSLSSKNKKLLGFRYTLVHDMLTGARVAMAAPALNVAALEDARWGPRIAELRELWGAADAAHREVASLDEYWSHWVADEPGDIVLWPRHTSRMGARELTGRILAADQQLRAATTAGRAYAMHVARVVARAVYEAHCQSRDALTDDRRRPSKKSIAKAVVAHLTTRCRARGSRAELFPLLLRPRGVSGAR